MINEYKIINTNSFKPYLRKHKTYNSKNNMKSLSELVKQLNRILKLDSLIVEEFYVVAIKPKYDVLGILQVSGGDANSCFVNKRSIGIFLLLSGAEEFVAIHNHPNGTKRASEGDINASYILESFGNLLDIKLKAAICIGKEGWTNYYRKRV